MSLDNAIYSAAQDKIYGVNGQWIFKFNASTGAREAEFRFVGDNIFGEGSIVEVGGFLYVGLWREPASDFPDIYKIPYDFSSSTALGLTASGLQGYYNLDTDGTNIFFYGDAGVGTVAIYAFDPSNPIGTLSSSDTGSGVGLLNQIQMDTAHNIVWYARNARSSGLGCTDGVFPLSTGSLFELSSSPPAANQWSTGCAYVGTGKLYGVNGRTNAVLKGNAPNTPGSFGFSVLSILQSSARPYKIRYNPHDGLVYIPTFSGDTVEVLDPATDTISAIKTGFTAPFDCVFTPAKKWALQNYRTPLKEIT